MVGDADPYAGQQAASALEELGVVDESVRALGRPGGPERRRAESFVSLLAARGRTSRLRQLAEEHPDSAVRESLLRLLEGASGARS
jgi:hypothetical protein